MTDRAAFEAWYGCEGPPRFNRSGKYCNDLIESMWLAWQEAARQERERWDQLWKAAKLGHEQAFASSQKAHSALSAIQSDLNRMMASAVPEGGEWVEGYRIKCGALHRIFGVMQEAGYSVIVPGGSPSPSTPVQETP